MKRSCYVSIISFLYYFANICSADEIRKSDLNEAVVLTPLIEEGKVKEAQYIAKVKSNLGIESYNGWLTVDQQYNSNLFFWFFPSQKNYANAPVVLWLQGGPGASSLFGAFMENGPYTVGSNGQLMLRNYSWTENHSVLYIDNPVGTGFSYTNDDGYARNQTIIGNHLYEALLQFFLLFPELQENDFFVSGESYAGKYVPAVAYAIYKNNPTAEQTINLKGLAIGNGLCDPEHQMKYADYLYEIGLIDTNNRKKIKNVEKLIVSYIRDSKWGLASKTFDVLLNGDLCNGKTIFKNVTGFDNYFNYLHTKDSSIDQDEILRKFLESEDVRDVFKLGNATFHDGQQVRVNLNEDIMKSAAPWISELLSHYRVLTYNGQLDIIVGYPLTVNFLKHLKFDGANVYKTAKRHQWHVDEELAGYVKQAGNLTEILVRNAGHMVPADQPRWALDLLTKFTHNKPFW